MSKDRIEENGITAFRDFISDSKILKLKADEKDKNASLDGIIIVRKVENHKDRKDQIKGRVDIQIKSRWEPSVEK